MLILSECVTLEGVSHALERLILITEDEYIRKYYKKLKQEYEVLRKKFHNLPE